MVIYDDYLFFVESKPELPANILFALEDDLFSYNKLLEFGYIKFQNGRISFSFVGLIVLPNFNVCVLPKYFSGIDLTPENQLLEFVKIIKVLRKAGKIESSLPDFHFLNNNSNVNLSGIVIADQILRDYLDHGIFNQIIGDSTIDGSGEINWGMTIDLIDPVISKGRPIYFDSYSSLQSIDHYNIITKIHKFAVGTSLKKFGLLLDYQFIFDESFESSLSGIGSIEYLVNFLNKELNLVYGDREIALIKKLLAYIKTVEAFHSKKNLNIFGTGYFHTIWEKACSILFNNKIEKYKQYISVPTWNDLSGNSVFKEGLKPDIISETNRLETLVILDAKYYNLSYQVSPFIVTGNPGISDVTKQFLYQKIIEKNTGSKVFNFFVFPSVQKENFTIIGFTTFPLFQKEKIFNVKLSVNLALKSYLSNFPQSEEILTYMVQDIE